jgi:hypothetical protein
MRKIAFICFSASLIAASSTQMAAASSAHHARSDRGYDRWNYRQAYDQSTEPFHAVPQTHDGYSERRELSKPAANETRSCDIIWCYED